MSNVAIFRFAKSMSKSGTPLSVVQIMRRRRSDLLTKMISTDIVIAHILPLGLSQCFEFCPRKQK